MPFHYTYYIYSISLSKLKFINLKKISHLGKPKTKLHYLNYKLIKLSSIANKITLRANKTLAQSDYSKLSTTQSMSTKLSNFSLTKSLFQIDFRQTPQIYNALIYHFHIIPHLNNF